MAYVPNRPDCEISVHIGYVDQKIASYHACVELASYHACIERDLESS